MKSGTRSAEYTQELLLELGKAQSIIDSKVPHHDDPLEDFAIRGVWEGIRDHLLIELERLGYTPSHEL